MKILNKIKSLFCKHDFSVPEVVYDTPNYVPSTVIHPRDGNEIPVLKREFSVVSKCKKCGKVNCDRGYNSLPIDTTGTIAEQAERNHYRQKHALKKEGKLSRFKNKFK